jgi:Mor family transcriptional regulator
MSTSNDRPGWFNEPDLNKWHELSDSLETFLDILSIIGADGAWKLVREYGGSQIYIPKVAIIFRPIRDNLLREEFDEGANYQDLARKYDLSVSHVRSILA